MLGEMFDRIINTGSGGATFVFFHPYDKFGTQ
jgi:hypothetical protein